MGSPGHLWRCARVAASTAMFLPSCSGTVLLKELKMPPAHFSTALLAIALWAAPVLTIAASAEQGPAPATIATERQEAAHDQQRANQDTKTLPANEDWRHSFVATVTQARALVESGYTRAPTLVVVLSAFLVLPGVALVSCLVQFAARRKARGTAIRAERRRAEIAEPPTGMSASEAMPLWPHEAWLTLEDGPAGSLPLAAQMIRIGRHQDNDLRLPDTTVHRYHAVIERTPEEAFVITDLSGKAGNGIRVNGERLARAQLSDGDMIELGRTKLKFESVPV
jgi:FHA domain